MDQNEAGIIEIPSEDEEENEEKEETRPLSLTDEHCTKVMKKATAGKKIGTMIMHFQCKYCSKAFQGPSNGTALKHLRSTHSKKCPDVLPIKTLTTKPKRGNVKQRFDADIFMGKLLTWIIKTDQSFSTVDNEYFQSMLDYIHKDINIDSRRTIMRRLEELYNQRKDELKSKIKATTSKYSITCDVWTSKNQLLFFGIVCYLT